MACSAFTASIPKETYSKLGLLKKHAYAVIGVHEIYGEGGEILRLMKLRNTWGRFEWNGLFGRKSEVWRDGSPLISKALNEVCDNNFHPNA